MKNKKIVIVSIVVLLVPALGFGLNWFMSNKKYENTKYKTLKVEAEFNPSIDNNEYNGIVAGDMINKKIAITPKSTAESFIRVKVDKVWKDPGNDDIDANNITVNYSNSTEKINSEDDGKWYKAGDGYLYYIGLIDSNTKGDIGLIESMKFEGNMTDEEGKVVDCQNKTLNFEINMDVIQAKNGAYNSKWKNDNNKEIIAKLDGLAPDKISKK
ncbi:hypothetical protein CHL78_016025 [Romboutsia weinsteinii]|uniref:Camelysin metallo-endopeptidase n=1 Tax=Romboutsia weinsteinii TaxID=2020949 RepID=A0A371IZD5_9FIRM|nr:hypothetical protein [Romboutsia weinsteinii]RDY25851.1 hypothetical protein CHL78_016025 [Romboutsia weinsteinii]